MKIHFSKQRFSALLLSALLVSAAVCGKGFAENSTEDAKKTPASGSAQQEKCLYPKKEGVTRIVSYNVGVFNKFTPDDYPMIAAMMHEIDADAICLNELDSCTTRTGGIFQLGHFARLMGGWDCNYGAAMPYAGGKYGAGIASREKALRTFSVILEKGDGAEPRVLVVSEFETFVLATAHLDHVSARQRRAQAATINRIMRNEYGNSPKPVFLGGDMNARPDSETLRILRSAWDVLTPEEPTCPSRNPRMCIDYIMQLRNGVPCEAVTARVLRRFRSGKVRNASDHLPVMLDVILPGK